MKATAVAPSNIAFIKYWGRKDEILKLPINDSISMNLSNLLTTTTVAFQEDLKTDSITINNSIPSTTAVKKTTKQLDRIRQLVHIKAKAKVVSNNSFPSDTGLSSSASGFAALTVAAAKAVGLKLSEKELSTLARQGSGSACRSIPDGFVEWFAGDTSEMSYAISLYPPNHWDIIDVVAVVSTTKKEIPSTQGHMLAKSSIFFETRLQQNKKKIVLIKQYMKEKDFTKFGELVEAEALELHAIYMTSHPSLIYLLPDSVRLLHQIKKWRQEGLAVYFTLNTGQDMHVICEKKNAKKLQELLNTLPYVKKTIYNRPSVGAREITDHLF